jgi:hypothetical protein
MIKQDNDRDDLEGTTNHLFEDVVLIFLYKKRKIHENPLLSGWPVTF